MYRPCTIRSSFSSLAFFKILDFSRSLLATPSTCARTGSRSDLDTYGERASRRIWKSQNFSYWMTQMLHTRAEDSSFDRNRQLGELELVTGSIHGQRFLAEGYVGWDYEV